MLTFDDIYELYESEKREKRQVPKYYFNKDTQSFEEFNKIVKRHNFTEEKYYYEAESELYEKIIKMGYIPFIDSYEVCLQCMRKYLVQRNDKELTERFKKLPDILVGF